jgi:hypothetical protein
MQTDPKFLFFFAGYRTDCGKSLSMLKKRFSSNENVEDIAFDWRKLFPVQSPEKYWQSVADAIVAFVFGPDGATGFCGLDGGCSKDEAVVRGKRCSKSSDRSVACRKTQPTGIVLFVPSEELLLARKLFGSSFLIISIDRVDVENDLFGTASSAYRRIKAIKSYILNLPLEKKVIFLPFSNFYERTLSEDYANLWRQDFDFAAAADAAHRELYDRSLQNPSKKQVRGGYRLDNTVFFQRDRLHDSAKLGENSRSHGYHLLRAFFRFGVAVRPGLHFDVMREDGRSLNKQFFDFLTGELSRADSAHVNISPCDRLL